ncbi:MAG: molybdopterin dinucleotide binding domain-containing protein [Acidimicrobiia bacterium]
MNSWLGDLPGIRGGTRNNDVELHPDDAARLGLRTGDRVRVSSPSGAIELAATVSDASPPGVVTIEQGWGSSVFDPTGQVAPERYGVNRNALVNDTDLDPLSQMPVLNSQDVRVERM